MYTADFHIHTSRSFDCGTSAEEVCRAAIAGGISEIAITDHCDFPYILSNADIDEMRSELFRLKAEYEGRLLIRSGIELGDPHHDPARAREILSRLKPDFVLGSVHERGDGTDYYFVKYDKEGFSSVYEEYLDMTERLIDFGEFDSLAHIGYPVRYALPVIGSFSAADYEERLRLIFKKLIAAGKALEINTSPMRKGAGEPMPGAEVLKIYRQEGGELITIGSDAHRAEDVGAGLSETRGLLLSLGFKFAAKYQDRMPSLYKL